MKTLEKNAIVIYFYLFEWYLNNPWKEMKVPIQFLNIYLFEVLMALFLCIFGRLKWSLRLQSIFFMVVGLANYYIISFRSAPIMPWDIYSLGTALSVANNFKYDIERQTVIVLVGAPHCRRCCLFCNALQFHTHAASGQHHHQVQDV